MVNKLFENPNFKALEEGLAQLKKLPLKKHKEAINRIFSEKVEFRMIDDKNNHRFLIGARGIQNTFGNTAEDNARKTIEYIKEVIAYLGYTVNLEYNGFNENDIAPLQNMYIIETDKEFYDMMLCLQDFYNYIGSRNSDM